MHPLFNFVNLYTILVKIIDLRLSLCLSDTLIKNLLTLVNYWHVIVRYVVLQVVMIARDTWAESEIDKSAGSSESAEFLPAVAGGLLLASLLSLCAMLVMMSGASSTDSKDDVSDNGDEDVTKSCRRVASRRFRSLSVSVDLQHSADQWNGSAAEAGGMTARTSWERQQLKVLYGASDRYRTMSTNYIERYRALHYADCADLAMWKAQGLEMLRHVPEAFPFQSLPVDCRLKVFSMLSITERGRAARVCKDWCALMRMPELWSNVDFLSFAFCQRCAKTRRDCTLLCYTNYRTRMKSFFRFLFSVRPKIRRLCASFDIGHHRDGWLEQLQASVLCNFYNYLSNIDCQCGVI